MSAPVLHNYDLDDSCYKVRLLAACMGQPLETVAVDVFPGREHLSPRYLALNPTGGLPILQDGDLTLWGAEAIMLHLARTRPGGARFLPEAPERAAHMHQWLVFAAGPLGVTSAARATAMLGAPGDLDALRDAARQGLRAMDDHMAKSALLDVDWFAGPDPSLADLALFPAFALSRDYSVGHEEFPALRQWARRVRRLDGFVTMPGIPDYH